MFVGLFIVAALMNSHKNKNNLFFLKFNYYYYNSYYYKYNYFLPLYYSFIQQKQQKSSDSKYVEEYLYYQYSQSSCFNSSISKTKIKFTCFFLVAIIILYYCYSPNLTQCILLYKQSLLLFLDYINF